MRLHDFVREVPELTARMVARPDHFRPALLEVVLEGTLLTVASLVAVGALDGRVLTSHDLGAVRQLDRDGTAPYPILVAPIKIGKVLYFLSLEKLLGLRVPVG